MKSSKTNAAQPTTELLCFIKGNCKHVLGPSFWDIRHLSRVEAGWKQDRLEARILALSKFRLFFLSGKVVNKLQVECSLHLLNLSSIETVTETQLLCSLEDGRRLYIRVGGNTKAIDLATALLQAVKHYFPSCTDSLKLFLDLKPAELYAEFAALPSVKPSLPCENFRRTYAALCDYYKLPFRDEVGWDVDKIYACHDNRMLRLEDFNHLMQRDLVPIVAVLQYNNWFNGLIIENIKIHGELQDTLRDIFKKSQWLKVVRLRNCGLRSDFLVQLSQAFHANQSLPLEVLDLSNNNFEEHKAAIGLGNAFPVLGKGVREVYFSECGLNIKGVNGLANGLFRSQLNSPGLKILNLSWNNLKEDVNDVHNLLSHCQVLEVLDLSGTGIILDKLWGALKYGGLCLKNLNLSSCAFSSKKSKDPGVPSALKEFFSSAVALKKIDLSDCFLPAEILKSLLLGLACNQQLKNIELNLSKSCVERDRQAVSILETSLPNVRAVTKLVIRDNGFDHDLCSLLPAVGRMPSLVSLDLGANNFSSLRKQQPKQLTPILMELVKIINDEDAPLRELVLSDCRLGVHMSVLLNALGPSPCLRVLDISGNEMGNFGARLLAKALQINASLETVVLDRNQITADGYADILHATKENYFLLSLPYPLIDAVDSYNRGDKERMYQILSEIGKLLERNQAFRHKRNTNDLDQSEKSFLAQSRLTLGNMEEELNRVEYSSQQVLSDCSLESTDADVLTVKKLIEDAEKAKQLLSNMLPMLTDVEFVNELVLKTTKDMEEEIQRRMRERAQCVTKFPETNGFSVSSKQDFLRNLVEQSNQKAQVDLSAGMCEFRNYIKTECSAVSMGIAHCVTGEIIKEISADLAAATKKLGHVVKSSSLTSLTQQQPVSPSPSGNVTPKSKKKQKFFQRHSRPKSVVEGEAVAEYLSAEMSSSDELGSVFDVTPAASPASPSSRTADGLVPEEGRQCTKEAKPLVHLQKARPRNPKKRYSRNPKPDICTTLSAIDSGLSDFFGPYGISSQRTIALDGPLPVLGEVNETEEEEGVESPRLHPSNEDPVITTEMVHKSKILVPGKTFTPPRVPPNTPMGSDNMDADSTECVSPQNDSPPPLPPKLPRKPSRLSNSSTEGNLPKEVGVGMEGNEWVMVSVLPASDDSSSSKTQADDENESRGGCSDTKADTASSSHSNPVVTGSSSEFATYSSSCDAVSSQDTANSQSQSASTSVSEPSKYDSSSEQPPVLPPKPESDSDSGKSVGASTSKEQRKSVMDLKGMFEKQPPKPAPRSSKNKIVPPGGPIRSQRPGIC